MELISMSLTCLNKIWSVLSALNFPKPIQFIPSISGLSVAQVTGHGEHQVYVTINWPDQHITEIRRWNGLDDFTLSLNTTPTRDTHGGTIDIRYSISIWAINSSIISKSILESSIIDQRHTAAMIMVTLVSQSSQNTLSNVSCLGCIL